MSKLLALLSVFLIYGVFLVCIAFMHIDYKGGVMNNLTNMLKKVICSFKGHIWVMSKFQVISYAGLNYECKRCGKLI